MSRVSGTLFAGLSHEENLRKMRLLTFMQMAENKKDIDYDSIQKEMDINEDDVEDFIIDGIFRTKPYCIYYKYLLRYAQAIKADSKGAF